MPQSAVITAPTTSHRAEIVHAAFCTDHVDMGPQDQECRAAAHRVGKFGPGAQGIPGQPVRVVASRFMGRAPAAIDWEPAESRVFLDVNQDGEWQAGVDLTPAEARVLAAALLDAADTAEVTR